MKKANTIKAIIAGVAGIATAPASAAIIDFGGLPTTGPFNGNGASFTSPYFEDGFKVTAPSGQFVDSTDTGNGDTFSLLTGAFNTQQAGLLTIVSAMAGQLFNFGGFDIKAVGATGSYGYTGYNGNQVVFSSNGVSSNSSAFSTINSRFAGIIDRLTISTGSTNQIYLDNINATLIPVTPTSAVPEPKSWAMMIGGFVLAGAALRYNRRKTTAKLNIA